MSGANNFDFLVGSWNIHNKRKRGKSFWADQEPEDEAMWEEFPASDLVEKDLDGRAVVEHYEATLPSGESVKGLSMKALDPTTINGPLSGSTPETGPMTFGLSPEHFKMGLAHSLR